MCVCVCVCVCVYTVHTHRYTYMHAYIHTENQIHDLYKIVHTIPLLRWWYTDVLPVRELNANSFCLHDVMDWMAAHFLKLNENKTDVIVFGPRKHDVLQCLNATSLTVKYSVNKLGFVLHSDLKLDRQINTVVRSCCFYLRLLVKTKPFLSRSDFEKAITSIVLSLMDYCNSLYYGVDVRALMRLQKIQNAAAKMIKSAKKYESVTSLLISLAASMTFF